MEGLDLTRLNPVGFERLVRALCFSALGPAGIVYSAGPDGGRDFTYEGPIAGYESKGWSGYLVVQAKFKDAGSKDTDIEWLKAQLSRELKKYTDPHSQLKAPEYYILVTNVRLSGADGVSNKKKASTRKGGLSKAMELFDPWTARLNLKDFDIWSHDKVIDLIVERPEIRQTYAQWVTSGDVLTKALQHFSAIRPDFSEVANRALKNALHRDQFVRLKDAGSVGDLQIRTSQVVVDLPLARGGKDDMHFVIVDEDGGEVEEEEETFNAIAELVDRAKEKLDAETLIADEEIGAGRDLSRNRIVLMGGPGQGKRPQVFFSLRFLGQ